jgi:hypothetical protein
VLDFDPRLQDQKNPELADKRFEAQNSALACSILLFWSSTASSFFARSMSCPFLFFNRLQMTIRSEDITIDKFDFQRRALHLIR